jgi:hypothetical protein
MLYDAVWLVQSSAMPNLQQIMVSKIEAIFVAKFAKKRVFYAVLDMVLNRVWHAIILAGNQTCCK